ARPSVGAPCCSDLRSGRTPHGREGAGPDPVRRGRRSRSRPRPSRSFLPARGLAVVIMFRELAGPIRGRYQLVLWAVVALDVMVVAWMLAAGEWLDSRM